MDKADKVVVISKVLKINRGDAEAIVTISEAIDSYPDQIRNPIRKLAGKADELEYHEGSPVEGWDGVQANQLVDKATDEALHNTYLRCVLGLGYGPVPEIEPMGLYAECQPIDKWQGDYHDGDAVLQGAKAVKPAFELDTEAIFPGMADKWDKYQAEGSEKDPPNPRKLPTLKEIKARRKRALAPPRTSTVDRVLKELPD